MFQSVSFLPETQKRIHKNVSYVEFSRKNLPKCQPMFFLQLAPPAPVLLLELAAIKALRVMSFVWNLANSSPCTRTGLRR